MRKSEKGNASGLCVCVSKCKSMKKHRGITVHRARDLMIMYVFATETLKVQYMTASDRSVSTLQARLVLESGMSSGVWCGKARVICREVVSPEADETVLMSGKAETDSSSPFNTLIPHAMCPDMLFSAQESGPTSCLSLKSQEGESQNHAHVLSSSTQMSLRLNGVEADGIRGERRSVREARAVACTLM